MFYYVYGILHSPDYRERFAENLSKDLPRLPAVKQTDDLWVFSKAGRGLADLHLNYETVAPYRLTIETEGRLNDPVYRVKKMKVDKTTVIYNSRVNPKGILEEGLGLRAQRQSGTRLDMEREAVPTDKTSSVVNYANDWAVETMGKPKYPLELFKRITGLDMAGDFFRLKTSSLFCKTVIAGCYRPGAL